MELSAISACRPVFLTGCHRSGTTLLRFVLDSHPKIACPPESKIFLGVNAFLSTPQVLRGLGSLGTNREDLMLAFRTFADTLLGAYANRKGKDRWIEKTPNHVSVLDLIDEIYEHCAQYILIVRHPLDCIDSLSRYFPQPRNHEDSDISDNCLRHGIGHYAWAQYWLQASERILLFSELIQNRCIITRYEDLVSHPHIEIERLFNFLGEATPPDILVRAFQASHDGGFQDSKIKQTSMIHQASLGKWKAWPELYVQHLWDKVHNTATRFGYSVEL